MSEAFSADVRHEDGHIVERAIEDELRESFLDYSMSVIVSRALPDARDGLKPVQRRILHAMNELSLTPVRPYKKSATVVGEVLGKYHPHGDSAVYETLVRMAQDFSLAEPLIDGQGNFGSIDGDPAAAYRYTEARLTAAAMEILADIDRSTVDFVPTFDDANKEPSVLPSRLPNLLVNGSTGIAVGMATNIPPHNLREIAKAIALLCDLPDASDSEVYACIKGPDFPTGGLVLKTRKGIHDFLRTGEGKMTMRAAVHVEREVGGRTSLVVTEIPYGVIKATIVEQIADEVREKRIEGIADLRDESDRDGIRIVVALKRDADPQKVLDKLYQRTMLEKTFGGKLLALVDGRPVVLSVRQALEVFVDHRLRVVVRRAEHDLGVAERRQHIVAGLLIAIDAIDRVVAIIKGSKTREAARDTLMKQFKLSELQATEILNLRLARLTALDVTELREEAQALEALIADLTAFLADPARQRALVRDETLEVSEKFGRPRRTKIVSAEEASEIARQAADEQATVLVTAEGRIWAAPVGSRSRDRSSGGEDPTMFAVTARASDTLAVFTTSGRYFPVVVGDLLALGGKPRTIAHVLDGAGRDERVLWIGTTQELAESGDSLLFVTRGGQVKRTAASEYAAPRNGGVIAAGVKDDDQLLTVLACNESDEVVLFSREGMAIRFTIADVPTQGRTAQGVRGMKLRAGDEVVAAALAGSEIAVISAGGYGKRTDASEYPVQGRGGLGVKSFRDIKRVGGAVVWGGSAPFTPALWLQIESAAEEAEWVAVQPGDLVAAGRATHGEPINAVPSNAKVGAAREVPGEVAGRVLRRISANAGGAEG